MGQRGLLALLVGAVATWGAWAAVVILSTPDLWISQFLFFALLFSATLLTSTLGAYGLSPRLFSLKRHQRDMTRSFLQGIPVAVLITGAAWLQSLRALSLPVGAILLGATLVAQFMLLPKGGK